MTEQLEDDVPEKGRTDDLRAAIEAAYDASTAEPTEALADDEVAVAAEESDDRTRDASGRFAAKQISDDQATTPVEETLAAIPLPKSWSADQAERFAALPRETQEYLATRESDRERLLGRNSQQAARYEKTWEPVERELRPYIQTLEKTGMPLHQAMGTLLRAQTRLDENPVEAIIELCRSYGVNPAQLAGAQQGATHTQPQRDPQVQHLASRLERLEHERIAAQRASEERELSSLESEVQAFATEKGANGAPLRPHWDRLIDDVTAFTASLRQRHPDDSPKQILDRAYRAALALDPGAQAEASRAAEQQRLVDTKAKAEKARRAGSSVTASAPGNGVAPAEANTVREALLAAWDKHTV